MHDKDERLMYLMGEKGIERIMAQNDEAEYKISIPVPEYPKRLIVALQDGYCNLKCPMCYVHGSNNREVIKKLRGSMSFSDACRIFDEVSGAKPSINPNSWTEPFIKKDIRKYLAAIKERGIHLTINTNGLLLTPELSRFLVQIKLDSIFVSIDATTVPTLEKIRGVRDLDKIKQAVFNMLEARENLTYPRIGVSFVSQDENRHEKEEFIAYWLKHVDVVRINEAYSLDKSVKSAELPLKRIPCGALYDTMAINHRGDVVICCLDSFNEVVIGNVFKDSIKKVWRSENFNSLRFYHETGQYDKVPFCKKCGVWANYLITEETKNGILIRQSPIMTHYNRIDRLKTWKAGRG